MSNQPLWTDIINSIAGLLTAGATSGLLIAGFRGISQWREQLKGESNYKLASQILATLRSFQLKAIEIIERPPSLAEEEKARKALAKYPTEKWEKAMTNIQEFYLINTINDMRLDSVKAIYTKYIDLMLKLQVQTDDYEIDLVNGVTVIDDYSDEFENGIRLSEVMQGIDWHITQIWLNLNNFLGSEKPIPMDKRVHKNPLLLRQVDEYFEQMRKRLRKFLK